MTTKQQLQAKISQLQQWLFDHHPEDEQRPEIENQLRCCIRDFNDLNDDYN